MKENIKIFNTIYLPYTMPGIVTEVSAILVAITAFLIPLGACRKTLICSEFGNDPYIGKTYNLTTN